MKEKLACSTVVITVVKTRECKINISIMVGERGLEPPRVAPLAPKASVYTNFTTHPSD